MSFTEVLQKAQEKDPEAINTLLARWRPLLRLQARHLLGAELSARVDPSDVVQESLAQVAQSLDQFRGQTEGEWLAWLRSIVAGQAAMTWRRHNAEKRSLVREQTCIDVVSRDGDPVAGLIDAEDAARLAAAIESLPHDMNRVVLARVFDRVPFEDLARSMERSPGAVRVIWSRAVKRLRQVLESESAHDTPV